MSLTPISDVLHTLPQKWRERAEELDPYAPGAAEAWRRAAAEVEGALEATGDVALTPAQAGRESGYTATRIRQLVKDGTLPNAGTEEKPKVLRKHLPRRPGHGIVAERPPSVVDRLRQGARAVVHGG